MYAIQRLLAHDKHLGQFSPHLENAKDVLNQDFQNCFNTSLFSMFNQIFI